MPIGNLAITVPPHTYGCEPSAPMDGGEYFLSPERRRYAKLQHLLDSAHKYTAAVRDSIRHETDLCFMGRWELTENLSPSYDPQVQLPLGKMVYLKFLLHLCEVLGEYVEQHSPVDCPIYDRLIISATFDYGGVWRTRTETVDLLTDHVSRLGAPLWDTRSIVCSDGFSICHEDLLPFFSD